MSHVLMQDLHFLNPNANKSIEKSMFINCRGDIQLYKQLAQH